MKRWLRLVLQLLSLVLFGVILWVGGPEAWQQILAGDLGSVLFSFLLIGLATVLSATRLQLIAHSMTRQKVASWRHFYHLNMTARALGLVIPRSLSTLVGKSTALRALGIPIKRSVWIVMIDNLFDLGLLGILMVPALFLLKSEISLSGFVALALGLALVLTVGLWWAITTGRLLSLFRRLVHIPRLASALHLSPESAPDLLPTHPVALQALGLSILLNGAIAACFYFIACAVGLDFPWPLFAAGFPVTQLSLVLAVTPGGLGLVEAGWYGVLLLGGVSHQEALTFIIAQRAYIFIFVLVWAGFSTLLSLTAEGRNRA